MDGLLKAPLFLPDPPISSGRSDGGVTAFIDAGPDEQLGVLEQPGDPVVLLVAELLRDGHLDLLFAGLLIFVAPLALDYRKGDPIDKEHEVRPGRLVRPAPFHGEFRGDVVDILFRVFPIEVMKRPALAVALDGLIQAGPQGEEVINLFVGSHQPIVGFILQPPDRLAQVGLAEQVRLPLGLDPVISLQPGLEDPGQNHLVGPAIAKPQRLLPAEILPPQGVEHLDRRDYRIEVFKVGEPHGLLLCSLFHISGNS